MRKALFLDRDGVLNRELGRYVTSVDEFEILPTVVDALKLASDKGFTLIIMSNQGGVAKGLYTIDEVRKMQQKLEGQLATRDVTLTEAYYCPHHPDHGKCLCRKPQSLMLEKAIARFHIDPASSFMIGDSIRDMEAANAAGVHGILVEANGSLFEHIKTLS